MGSGVAVGSARRWGWRAVVAGIVVGLLTGIVGLLVTTAVFSTQAGGLLGAVGCGATVAYLSREGVHRVVLYAVVADVASSILFFVLVLFAYLTAVWVTEGLAFVSAIWFSMMYLVFGGLVAVPVAVVSLVVTGLSAAVTSLMKRRLTGSTTPG